MNILKTKNQIIFIACGVFLIITAVYFLHAHNNSGSLPQDLMLKGQPISNSQMSEIVPLITYQKNGGEIDLASPGELPLEDTYEWSYIGTLPSGDHLIYAYWWPADGMGKYTEIAVVRRIGNTLKTISQIEGGNHHATMITKDALKLEKRILTYDQCMTTGLLYTFLLDTLPKDERQQIEKRNTKKLYWGEADYMGYATMQATFNTDGTLKETTLLSFTSAKDCQLSSPQNEYWDNWEKQTEKDSLDMGDALLDFLALYRYKNKTDTLDLQQLQEILLEASSYAK